MAACKSCGEPAGALKSSCSSCSTKEAAEFKENKDRLLERLGPLANVNDFVAFFQTYEGDFGVGQATIMAHEFKDGWSESAVLAENGNLGLTSTGIAFTRKQYGVPKSGFAPFVDVRDVVVGASAEVSVKSGFYTGASVKHFMWIKLIFLDLNIYQVLYPIESGNERSYLNPVAWIFRLSKYMTVTIQDPTIEYVFEALHTPPFTLSNPNAE